MTSQRPSASRHCDICTETLGVGNSHMKFRRWVGRRGFEPLTSCVSSRRSNQAELTAPGRTGYQLPAASDDPDGVIERRAGFEPAALRLCRPFPWSARAPARELKRIGQTGGVCRCCHAPSACGDLAHPLAIDGSPNCRCCHAPSACGDGSRHRGRPCIAEALRNGTQRCACEHHIVH